MSRATLKNVQIGQIKSIPTAEVADPVEDVGASHRRTYVLNLKDNSVAASPITETVVAQVARAGRVVAFSVTAPVGITGSDSNYATVSLSRKTAAGAAVNISVANSQTTGLLNGATALVPVAITLTANSVVLAAGDVLFVAATKTSAGVALTANTSAVTFSVDVEET